MHDTKLGENGGCRKGSVSSKGVTVQLMSSQEKKRKSSGSYTPRNVRTKKRAEGEMSPGKESAVEGGKGGSFSLADIDKIIKGNNKNVVDAIQASLTKSINEVRTVANANSAAIEEIREEIRDIRATLVPTGNIDVECAPGPSGRAAAASVSSQDVELWGLDDENQARTYYKSSRSLRLWPVPGQNQGELLRSVEVFLRDSLGMAESEVNLEDIEMVRRLKTGRRSKAKDEALVVFKDQLVRDNVSRRAPNLSECFDSERNPTAGIKMEIPQYLLGVFNLLQDHGHELKRKFGEGFKRHVKFDDFNQSLFLEVKFPGNEKWHIVTPEIAMEVR